jgi:hypothetical protein
MCDIPEEDNGPANFRHVDRPLRGEHPQRGEHFIQTMLKRHTSLESRPAVPVLDSEALWPMGVRRAPSGPEGRLPYCSPPGRRGSRPPLVPSHDVHTGKDS